MQEAKEYRQEKMIILATIMDDMEKWGVLAKPESLGIVPMHVHPCILVPKESGKHRLVTDFRSIQSHKRLNGVGQGGKLPSLRERPSTRFRIGYDFQ